MRFFNSLTPRAYKYTVLNGICLLVLRVCDVLDVHQESNPGVKKRPAYINGFIVTRTHTHTKTKLVFGGLFVFHFSKSYFFLLSFSL